MKGKLYVVHSPRDCVLTGFVPITGTIDGQFLVQAAGLVGLRQPRGASQEAKRLFREKVKNVGWRPSFARYGHAGGHTDGISYGFIRNVVATKMLKISRTRSAGQPAPPAQEDTVSAGSAGTW